MIFVGGQNYFASTAAPQTLCVWTAARAGGLDMDIDTGMRICRDRKRERERKRERRRERERKRE